MKKTIAALAVLVMLAAIVVPGPAEARGGHGWHGGWWWPGAVIGGLVLGTAALVTYPFYAAAAAVTQPAPVYQAPVVVAQPAPVYAPPPTYAPPPAVQREVVYPNGRYVLYGDGVSQPWQWVWIPAPGYPRP